ncbi:hypothetical protein BH23ACT9_BH23ACT9_21790 [soil metagenome]
MGAVGAQGVDLTPLLDRRGGTLTTTVDEDTTVMLQVTNTTDEERTVTVFAAAAPTDDAGQFSVGPTVDWIMIPGGTDLHLEPMQQVVLEAQVQLPGFRRADFGHVALVLEVQGGGNVTPRAATIVALHDSGASLPIPLSLLIMAFALLLTVSAAWVRTVRHQSSLRPRGHRDQIDGGRTGAPPLAPNGPGSTSHARQAVQTSSG